MLERGWERAAAAAMGLLVCACSAWADDYDRIASPLAAVSRARNRSRLAVLPFQEIGGRGSAGGRIVAERLIGPLAASEGLQVVERSMLDSVMKEQRLQVSGVTDRNSLRELGRVLGVDAIVTGTVIGLKGDRVEIVARLIDAETARVLGVAEVRVEKDWNESMFDENTWAELPPLPSWPNFDLAQTASAETNDCAAIHTLERSITDVKAKYWAVRLRAAGGAASALQADPGAAIADPEQRADFYSRLREYARAGGAGPTPAELGRMKTTMERISRLADACRGGRS